MASTGVIINRKKVIVLVPLLCLLICSIPVRGNSQTLAQFTTSRISSEGEGGIFVLGGNNSFRTGFALRFLINRISDLGFQMGIESFNQNKLFGGGMDVKLLLVKAADNFPFDISIDVSGGYLKNSEISKTTFSGALMMSTEVPDKLAIPFEPYISIGTYLNLIRTTRTKYFLQKNAFYTESSDCIGCSYSTSREYKTTGATFRAGVMFHVTHDTQFIIEANINGATFIGGGINLIF